MNQCQEFKDAMQELIDANRDRVEAYGNRKATNGAIARMEIAERKALSLTENGKKMLEIKYGFKPEG